MPPEVPDPTRPRAWLRVATSDLMLARAGRGAPGVLYEHLCFHAQQAAEKALKAVLVSKQVAFPKTHVLGELLNLLHQTGASIPDRLWEAVELTPYAVRARYPAADEDVEEEEYRVAVEIAGLVVVWAEEQTTTNE